MWRHYGQRGGIAVYTRHILESLPRIDRENDYVIMLPPGQPPPGLGGDNVEFRTVGAASRWLWDQVAVPRFARRERIELVFNPKLSVPFAGGFRTVFMLHGMEQFVQSRVFPPVDRMYARVMMPRYCRRADGILCPSQTVKDDIIEHLRVPTDKIHVTPHGVDERFVSRVSEATRARVRARYELPPQYLLFVGGLTPLKNLGTILRAMKQLRQQIPHHLVLCGFHRWRSGPEFRLITELELADRVITAGWVDDEDLPCVYQMASALLFPSLYEGFGLPVLEAMASGCPVVASTGGALPEVANGAALLVEPTDFLALANAIRRLIEDPALTNRLVRLGTEHAARFSWLETAQQVRSVFAHLTGAE
jgi:glycosyltransferase involved in cell wall biosynthesis